MGEKVYRTELTPVSFLRRSAYMFPDKTAVVHGDRRYTYKEFEERVDRLASRLRDADLQKGDRVAFLCPNSPPMLEAHFPAPAAGNVLVAINTRLAAPTVQIGIVNDGSARELDTEVTAAVAAPPSPTLLGQLAALNIRPLHVYGLTETYGPITTNAPRKEWEGLGPEEHARLLARQGQGYVTSDLVRVVDDEMNDVPRDGETMGEIVMRGNMVMKEYLDNERATEAAFKGGWYHSGDVAVWDEDGRAEIRDRRKDVIISGGENISTIEVEQVVVGHPAVMEAAVVAIPDEEWGERPKAFVTLKNGKQATEEEIIDFVKERIASFKAPAAVEFGELPKTATGKVQKYVLREKEWAGREKKIN